MVGSYTWESVSIFLRRGTLHVSLGNNMSDVCQLQNGTTQGSICHRFYFGIWINDFTLTAVLKSLILLM